MLDDLERLLGAPVSLTLLKHKPGRRRTFRARGPRGSAIVKVYASDRAPEVARRVAVLAQGPPEPVVPVVLGVAPDRQAVILSDVPGRPLRAALLAADGAGCRRAGRALGQWHAAWGGVTPPSLRQHSADAELDILRRRAAACSREVASAVKRALADWSVEWQPSTVVHRDLYEEQVLVDDRIGLIDVDDTALGPAELDVGNLLAHIELLERRQANDTRRAVAALVDGYSATGPALDPALVDQCRRLTLLRLACLNDDVELARLTTSTGRAVR